MAGRQNRASMRFATKFDASNAACECEQSTLAAERVIQIIERPDQAG
jgi:hypothetical protein